MNQPTLITTKAHLVVAGVSGLAVTVLEFAAVRYMAPSFGQSSYVWANVIGIILLALSLGYWFGGRLADRSETGRPLYTAYVLAAGYVTAIAFLGSALCQALVPTEVGTERLLPLAFTGSLFATILLFGPPTLVLGMTSPFLIRLDDQPGRAGTVAGRIFAVGTLGSLAGCYLGPLLLFPTIGSRASILLCAAALAALGVGGLLLGRGRSKAGGVAAAAVLLASLGLGGWAYAADLPLRSQEGQLAEMESAYQSVRVVEGTAWSVIPTEYPLQGKDKAYRALFLQHDEDTANYQSVWLPDDSERLLTGGRYYDHLALGALFERPKPVSTLRVMVIGYAGGAVHRVLRLTKPAHVELSVLGIEIDPKVVEISRKFLALDELEKDDLRIITDEDARTVVNALPETERFDLILVDAYTRTSYVPFQLASVEFFAKTAKHLAPGGWVGVNLHSSGSMTAPLVKALATTMEAAQGLGDVWLVPNPLFPGSLVLWAGGEGSAAPRIRGDRNLPESLLLPALALERLQVRFNPKTEGTHVLTDDLSDVDRLTDEALYGR